MNKVTIITSLGREVYAEGNTSVDEGTGTLKVHDTAYTCVARFERGYWAGYTVETEERPPLACASAPMPAPAMPDDRPF